MRLWMLTALFLLIGAGTDAGAGEMSPYQIEVTSREIKNRIVESTVRGHAIRFDQPKEFGADDSAPTPPEYLAASFGACLVSTMRFVAMLEGLDIRDVAVTVTGAIDFSRAMGLPSANRAGFGGLTVAVFFNTDMTMSEKQQFLDRVMQRGAALDNVANATPLVVRLQEDNPATPAR